MKDMNQRQQRVANIVREQVATLLLRGNFADPVLMQTPVTLTNAWVAPDLSQARLAYCTHDNTDDHTQLTQALNALAPEFQQGLRKKLNTKYTPKIRFEYDDAYEAANKLDDVFKRIGEKNGSH